MNTEYLYKIYLDSNQVVIDTRKITKGDLFFGLTGGTTNGSKFAEQAIDAGANCAIVDDKNYENQENNIFYVENSLIALQELAKYHRSQLKIPVFALTGSNGKTTTKELIASVIQQKFNVQFTQGNLNNHIGVPLTILSIKPEHNFAIIEMGANHQKEIQFLSEIARPDIGYITNYGKAHLEGFGGVEGIIKGKSELYDFLRISNGTALINSDDKIQIEKSQGIKSIRYGKNEENYSFSLINKDVLVGVQYNDNEIITHLTGNYNFTNICAAIRLGLHFEIPIQDIKKGLETYIPSNHRSQILEKNGKKIVMDSYNANPSSMEVALTNFSLFAGTKTVILGDMFELGEETIKEHTFIKNHAEKLNFTQKIFVGIHFSQVSDKNSLFFKSTEELINYLKNNTIEMENILVKGSRGMKLEQILDFV